MLDANPDRFLEAQADAHLERERLPVCEWCPSTGPLRRFYGTLMCKRCADETQSICTECGGCDIVSPDEGPDYCMDCRAVECTASVDWDEGTPPEGER